jgi:hypothetical protein
MVRACASFKRYEVLASHKVTSPPFQLCHDPFESKGPVVSLFVERTSLLAVEIQLWRRARVLNVACEDMTRESDLHLDNAGRSTAICFEANVEAEGMKMREAQCLTSAADVRMPPPPTNQAVGFDITPWVYLSRNFRLGAGRLGAVLTRVNGVFLGNFGRNAGIVTSPNVPKLRACRPLTGFALASAADG